MMTLSSAHAASEDRRVRLLGAAGLGLLGYGLACILVMYGSFTFLAFEAESIEPLVSNSPFLAWLYPLFGLRGTSALIGIVEVGVGVLIATRR
jgi:reactive chlorine resistance protein C